MLVALHRQQERSITLHKLDDVDDSFEQKNSVNVISKLYFDDNEKTL